MRVRALDENHDWTFGRGLRSYLIDSAAISQNVKTRILSLKDDWFLDASHGIRWFNYLEKNPDISAMETELKTAILKTSGVEKLTAFSIQLDTESRHCVVDVSYIDVFGKEERVYADY